MNPVGYANGACFGVASVPKQPLLDSKELSVGCVTMSRLLATIANAMSALSPPREAWD